MGRVVDYVVVLEDGVRKRHMHETQAGQVIRFVVQLECLVGDDWKPVMRYDCTHGFAHLDRYDRRGHVEKSKLDLEFAHALTYSDWDVNEHWSEYITEFRRG